MENKKLDKYFLIKEEFDLEIAYSQITKIIKELIHKYQIVDETYIKVFLTEIFAILTEAKNKKKVKEEKGVIKC